MRAGSGPVCEERQRECILQRSEGCGHRHHQARSRRGGHGGLFPRRAGEAATRRNGGAFRFEADRRDFRGLHRGPELGRVEARDPRARDARGNRQYRQGDGRRGLGAMDRRAARSGRSCRRLHHHQLYLPRQ